MPFAATWMDLEILIVSEVSQRKTNRNLKEGTNELKYKTEIVTDIKKLTDTRG